MSAKLTEIRDKLLAKDRSIRVLNGKADVTLLAQELVANYSSTIATKHEAKVRLEQRVAELEAERDRLRDEVANRLRGFISGSHSLSQTSEFFENALTKLINELEQGKAVSDICETCNHPESHHRTESTGDCILCDEECQQFKPQVKEKADSDANNRADYPCTLFDCDCHQHR